MYKKIGQIKYRSHLVLFYDRFVSRGYEFRIYRNYDGPKLGHDPALVRTTWKLDGIEEDAKSYVDTMIPVERQLLWKTVINIENDIARGRKHEPNDL